MRKIRRHCIDEWMLKNKPGKFAKMFAGKSNAATKRQLKQASRDAAKAAANA